MLRVRTVAAALLILFAITSHSKCDEILGPFTASGNGVTESIAYFNAEELMMANVEGISESIPENSLVLPVMIAGWSYDGWTGTITYYISIVEF